jgi:type II secretory pathway pseudopilin PulG
VLIGYVGARKTEFDWNLAAVVLTGLGTTSLGAVTGLLSWTTSQDVRASQRVAEAAEQQLKLARRERMQRPSLTLTDDGGLHTRVETDRTAYVRLVVANLPGRRAARGTRVLIDRYWRADNPSDVTTLGSPSLGWPSAPESNDASVVIFAGVSRPVDLGVLLRHVPGTAFEPADPFHPPEPSGPWHLKLALAGNLALANEREYLPAGSWVVRLIVGADEVDGRAYDVHVSWDNAGDTPAAALSSLAVQVRRAPS